MHTGVVGERDTSLASPMDTGVIADNVKIGVGVTVAGDEPFTGRGHPEWVARAIGYVLHTLSDHRYR